MVRLAGVIGLSASTGVIGPENVEGWLALECEVGEGMEWLVGRCDEDALLVVLCRDWRRMREAWLVSSRSWMRWCQSKSGTANVSSDAAAEGDE